VDLPRPQVVDRVQPVAVEDHVLEDVRESEHEEAERHDDEDTVGVE
jgi:hypothetical protein